MSLRNDRLRNHSLRTDSLRTDRLRRNSPGMLLLRSVEVAKLYLPAVLLWQSTQSRLDGWTAALATLAFWLYTASRLHVVVTEWWTTRIEVTTDGIRRLGGVLVREEIAVRWQDVASVQVSRPVLHRLLGCSTVRVGTGSQGTTDLLLEAVPDALAGRVEALFHAAGGPARSPEHGSTPPPEPDGEPPPGPADGERAEGADPVVYSMRPIDYLLVSITHGQFVLIVPLVLGAYAELSTWTRLPTADLVRSAGGAPWWLPALVVPAALLAALAYGYGYAWVRYRSFTVRVGDGGLHLSGGLASKDTRRLAPEQIRGLLVEQNPLMRLTGRGKLSVVARDPGGRPGTNVVFPSVAMPRISAAVDQHFPAYAGAVGPRLRPSSRGGSGLLVAAWSGVVLGACWALLAVLPPGVAVPLTAALALLGLVVVDRQWSAVDVDARTGLVRFRRGSLWVRRYAVGVDAVHALHEARGPLGRSLDTTSLALVVHDGRAVRLRAVGCPPAVAAAVHRAVQAPVPVLPGPGAGRGAVVHGSGRRPHPAPAGDIRT